LEGDYNELCDVWSLGVIMYILLWGYPPFGGKSDEQILENVRRANLQFPDRDWRGISTESKAMISRMLWPQERRSTA
jgi:calcium-dependent protein kinase